jgi:tRNA 2-thiouridine synthesizing protein A
MADRVLDTSGLNCPLPILKARKTLREMPPGATLEILATDPITMRDFPAFCRATGNQLLAAEEKGGRFRFVIKNPD